MAKRLSLSEINERFEIEGKPIRITGNFSNVHSTATFECSKGHQFDDTVLNVQVRTSTSLSSYCPQCGCNVSKLDDEGNRLLEEVNTSERTKLPILNQSLDTLNTEMTELSERIRVLNIEIKHVKWFTVNARKEIIRKSKIRVKQAELLAKQAARKAELLAKQAARKAELLAKQAARKAKKTAEYHLTVIQDLTAHPSRQWGVMLHNKRLISFQTEKECINWASIYYFKETGKLWNPNK